MAPAIMFLVLVIALVKGLGAFKSNQMFPEERAARKMMKKPRP